MHQWAIRGAIAVVVVSMLVLAGVAYHRYSYPYGWSHCCDKGLVAELGLYAEKHGGWFPRGEATPEASLSLVYRQNPALAYLLRGKTVPEDIVRARLERGELLTPETCGWHYVEGLRSDDDQNLALFWDKEAELSHFGERQRGGGHMVAFIVGSVRYVPGAEWEQFLAEQERMRAAVKR